MILFNYVVGRLKIGDTACPSQSFSTIVLSVCFVSETSFTVYFWLAWNSQSSSASWVLVKDVSPYLIWVCETGLSLNMELDILAKLDTANPQRLPVFLLPGAGIADGASVGAGIWTQGLRMEPLWLTSMWGLGSEVRLLSKCFPRRAIALALLDSHCSDHLPPHKPNKPFEFFSCCSCTLTLLVVGILSYLRATACTQNILPYNIHIAYVIVTNNVLIGFHWSVHEYVSSQCGQTHSSAGELNWGQGVVLALLSSEGSGAVRSIPTVLSSE